ncbi:sister chromatid cohesion protein PDS5 homolog D-like [Rutidosis leptorrhynchoides]|uniref:sister chromatid cohesion protein PDS5 homolog D-like n=1 Tax=Rutidosis leptorrhynchoides TaxID=125765 RepID=UPI003A98F707
MYKKKLRSVTTTHPSQVVFQRDAGEKSKDGEKNEQGLELQVKLMNAGKKLLILPSSNAELLTILVQTEHILSAVKQSPSLSMIQSMHPLIEVLIAKKTLRHPDLDVNISVAHCISEIMRIMAPENPYNNEQMKDFFELVVTTFETLNTASGGCYTKMTKVLKIFSKYRLPLFMLDLDLEGQGLIVRLFKQFLTVADCNTSVIVHEMEKIMTMIIEESEGLELRDLISTTVKKDKKINLPVCWQLAKKVLMNYAAKQQPHICKMRRDISIALYDYSKWVACIRKTASENDIKAAEVDNSLRDTISCTTHMIKVECPEEIGNRLFTVRICQIKSWDMVNLHSQDKLSIDYPLMPPKSVTNVREKRKRNDTSSKKKAVSVEPGENLVGSRIKVWWPDDQMYHQGVVKSFGCAIKMHKLLYDDGFEELINLKEEKWKLLKNVSLMTNCAIEHGENLVGKRIKIWRPLYGTYYEGVVKSFDSKHRTHKVLYDDGDEQLIYLKGKQWELIENAPSMLDSVSTCVRDSSNEKADHEQTSAKGRSVREKMRPARFESYINPMQSIYIM